MDKVSAGGAGLAEAFLKAMFNKWLDKRYNIVILSSPNHWEITIWVRNDKIWNKLPVRRIKYDGKCFRYQRPIKDENEIYLKNEEVSCDMMYQMDEFWRDCLRYYAKKEFRRRRSLPVFI